MSGAIGSVGLAIAMISFIWSITNTTAAITLLCLAAMPFITALLGFLFLNEKISLGVWISIIIAAIGIIIMAISNDNTNSIGGLIFGLDNFRFFNIFSFFKMEKRNTEIYYSINSRLIMFLISALVIINQDLSFLSTSKNQSLFATHGALVCIGLILYSVGSRHIQAAELTLLSLTEVIGGIFWVWVPLLGINEVPTNNTIIGGFLIFLSIFYYSLVIQNNKRFIGLN